jgi:hypothetical protein
MLYGPARAPPLAVDEYVIQLRDPIALRDLVVSNGVDRPQLDHITASSKHAANTIKADIEHMSAPRNHPQARKDQ